MDNIQAAKTTGAEIDRKDLRHNMNIIIFGTEEFERKCIEQKLTCPEINKIKFADGTLSLENMQAVKDFDVVWLITNSIIGENEAQKLEQYGVRYIVTRSAGTDHLDKEALRKHHIMAANVPVYSPSAISEHTIMLLLAAARKLKKSVRMAENSDFTLEGLLGTEIADMTIGVIGYGNIGKRTVEILKAFGADILVNTPHHKIFADPKISYATLSELYKRSDAIILHCPVCKENYHMINKASIEQMKDNVIIVNTARGALIDHEALLFALENDKAGAAALDVYEYEDEFVRTKNKPYEDEIFWRLISRDDVIYTSHIAFYTSEAMNALMEVTVQNVLEYVKTGKCINEIT